MSNENKDRNKETASKLNEEELNQVVGGAEEEKEKKPFDKDRVTRLPEI